jgi:hypothetical protein
MFTADLLYAIAVSLRDATPRVFQLARSIPNLPLKTFEEEPATHQFSRIRANPDRDRDQDI